MTRPTRPARTIRSMADPHGDALPPRTRRAIRATGRPGRATERRAAIRESLAL